MTRHELTEIEKELERAVIALNTSPALALLHARTAHDMMGRMLAPHEAGVSGIVVKEIEPMPLAVVDATLNALSGLGKAKE